MTKSLRSRYSINKIVPNYYGTISCTQSSSINSNIIWVPYIMSQTTTIIDILSEDILNDLKIKIRKAKRNYKINSIINDDK